MYAENLVREMLAVTVDQVMSWPPCEDYTRERVEELFAGREAMTALEILELDIPCEDILWAVLREELIPAETLHEFTCRCDAAADAAAPFWRTTQRGDSYSTDWITTWDAAAAIADAVADAVADAAWSAVADATAADAAWDAARSAQTVILQTLLREAENA